MFSEKEKISEKNRLWRCLNNNLEKLEPVEGLQDRDDKGQGLPTSCHSLSSNI